MFELDQYRQTYGDMDVFGGAAFKAIGAGSSSNIHKGQRIFEPTALPDNMGATYDQSKVTETSGEESQMNQRMVQTQKVQFSAVNNQNNNDMAKLQIQYNLLLKENNLIKGQ